jgi:hypothetical protein
VQLAGVAGPRHGGEEDPPEAGNPELEGTAVPSGRSNTVTCGEATPERDGSLTCQEAAGEKEKTAAHGQEGSQEAEREADSAQNNHPKLLKVVTPGWKSTQGVWQQSAGEIDRVIEAQKKRVVHEPCQSDEGRPEHVFGKAIRIAMKEQGTT